MPRLRLALIERATKRDLRLGMAEVRLGLANNQSNSLRLPPKPMPATSARATGAIVRIAKQAMT